MKKVIITIIMTLFFQAFQAETVAYDSVKYKNKWAVEIDPLIPFALKGIGFHVFVSPKKLPRFNFGLGIIANGRLPDFIINTDAKNKDMGWIYKINQGAGFEFEYYLKEQNNKWFTGIQLFTEEINITNSNEPSIKQHRTNIGMAVVRFGYNWQPFKNVRFYAKPWFGLGYTDIISAAFSKDVIPNTQVGNYEYNIQPLTPFATVHLGYKF
ncbi:MAG: hypothetical protein SFY56_13685 [Bacteroidota bacterium]|nr:hypothetical protein [Bacteroidota bacterium]